MVDKRAEANPNATKIRPHLGLRRLTGGLKPSCFLLAAVDESDLRINFFDNSLERDDGVTESESSGTVSLPGSCERPSAMDQDHEQRLTQETNGWTFDKRGNNVRKETKKWISPLLSPLPLLFC
jgi:hypothetical protein